MCMVIVQVAGLAGLLPAYRLWWSCAAPYPPLTWAWTLLTRSGSWFSVDLHAESSSCV